MKVKEIKFIFIGIISGIMYWLLEALLHTYIFDLDVNFIKNFIFLEPNELWMRTTFFCFLIFLGIYTQRVSNKRVKRISNIERERLYSLLNELPAFVYLLANDYTISYANRYFQEKFGKPKSKRCYEILSNNKQPCDECPISSVFVKKIPTEGEWKHQGSEWYQTYYYPFRDNNNEILALSLGINITDRKKAELVIKKREHDLGERVKELTCLYKISKLTQSFDLSVKQFFEKVIELIPSAWQYPDITCARLVFKDHEFKTENFIETKWTQKTSLTALGQVVGEIEVNYLKEMPEIDEGPFLKEERHLINAISENLERKIEHKKAEVQLKESEEKFRSITEQSFIGILIFQDNVIKYANEAMSKINEYSIQEILKLNSSELFNIIHPDDRDIAIERVKQLKLGANEIPDYYAYRLITKSGELKWVNVYSKLIQYKNKDAILTSMIDETEKLEAEMLIKEEIQKLKEIDQIKKDLIRRISHELKTPLTSILSTTILLLDVYKKELGSNVLGFIEMIRNGGKRLKNLVDNLMIIYELDSHELKLDLQTKNLVDVLQQCIIEVTPLLTNRRHTLKVDLPKELYIDIDNNRMRQAITNLLLNAIKYTPPEGNIIIQLCEYDSLVDIIIKDTGIGFKAEDKEKLFTKFGKIERHGKGLDVDTEGPGFGLYISNEIIHLHKGEIILESEGLNKGSIITARLFKNNLIYDEKVLT